MKLLVKILITLLLTVLLCLPVLQKISNDFLRDTISLHGSSISGNPVTIQGVSSDWWKKSVEISNLEINLSQSGNTTPAVQVKSSMLQWEKALSLKPSSNHVLPEILSLDELMLQDLLIVYDADSEGGNLIPLRKNIADSANAYLRQRLNATNNTSAEMPQRFTIHKLQLKNIRIDARSTLDNTRKKTFPVSDLQYTDVGMPENGISMPEVINMIAGDISATIHQQALAQGIITPPEIISIVPAEKNTANRMRAEKTRPVRTSEEAESPPEDSKVKQAAKNTGEAIKKLSRKLFGDKG